MEDVPPFSIHGVTDGTAFTDEEFYKFGIPLEGKRNTLKYRQGTNLNSR